MKARWMVLTAVAALAAVLLISSTQATAGSGSYQYVSIELVQPKGVPLGVNLDLPKQMMLKVTNRTRVVLRGDSAVLTPRKFISGTPPNCVEYKIVFFGNGCAFKLPALKPGKSAAFPVEILFTSTDFPGGVWPGTNSNVVTMTLIIGDKRFGATSKWRLSIIKPVE